MPRIIPVVLMALVLFASVPAAAFDGMPDMDEMPGPDIALGTHPSMHGSCPTPDYYMEHRDEIGLSGAQISDLRKLDFQLRRQKITKGAAVKALELELTEIVTNPDFKASDALSKLSEIEKARTDLRSEVIKTSAKARDLLDAGQRQALGSLLQEGPPAMFKKPGMRPFMKPSPDKDEMKERMMKQMMDRNMPQ